MKRNLIIIAGLLILSSVYSCQKEFLDTKPNKALLVPITLTDFQSLLDNLDVMNTVPAIERLATDEIYTNDDGWLNFASADERNSYIWAKDIYEGNSSADWNAPFQQIFYANIVLDGLKKLDPKVSAADYNRVKGNALFYRAFAYYNLAQLFSRQYNPQTAKQDPGIPIHLSSDVNLRPDRGSVQNVYDQIIADLNAATACLPDKPAVKSRPAKAASLGMLSRVYLTMGDYQNAQKFASQCLAISGDLLNYSDLDTTTYAPFPDDITGSNPEVIYHALSFNYDFIYSPEVGVDSLLIKSYVPNDLRKPLIFYLASAPFVSFNNSYSSAGFFAGIATDEIYLNQAEALARLGNTDEAMATLNTLLVKRFKKGTFVPMAATSGNDALKIILTERRKELYTNQGILRWVDLRRLNLDPKFAVTLTHIIKGQVYKLAPNDDRYVFPIPDDEIRNNHIEQNPR